MEKLLFENRYIDDDETVLEEIRQVTYGQIFRGIRRITLLYSVCAVISLLIHAKVLFVVALLLGCLLVFVAFFLPRLHLSSAKRETLRLNNGEFPETVVRFGERILLTEGAFSLTTEYAQIVEIRRLQHSIVLMTGVNTGIPLKPDAFTLGNLPDLLAFLEEKCPNLGNPSAICGGPTRRQRISRTIGGTMLGVGIGVLYGLHLAEVWVSPTLLVCVAPVWLAVSVFLMIAPKSIFK